MEREIEVLTALAYATRDGRFVAPIDVGGQNGTHHSYTLTKLAKRGLAERRRWKGSPVQCRDTVKAGRSKGSWEYHITEAGDAEAKRIISERRFKRGATALSPSYAAPNP